MTQHQGQAERTIHELRKQVNQLQIENQQLVRRLNNQPLNNNTAIQSINPVIQQYTLQPNQYNDENIAPVESATSAATSQQPTSALKCNPKRAIKQLPPSTGTSIRSPPPLESVTSDGTGVEVLDHSIRNDNTINQENITPSKSVSPSFIKTVIKPKYRFTSDGDKQLVRSLVSQSDVASHHTKSIGASKDDIIDLATSQETINSPVNQSNQHINKKLKSANNNNNQQSIDNKSNINQFDLLPPSFTTVQSTTNNNSTTDKLYPYIATERNHDARRALPGYSCDECSAWYAQHPDSEMTCNHVSRHRYAHQQNYTPDNYYNLDDIGTPKSYTTQHTNNT